jgi:aspartate carbamoyltransferase catalytic subunit
MYDLKGKDILDGAQFTRDQIDGIMDVAADFRTKLESERGLDLLKGYVLAAIFFEPSTRTRLSFETAMHRLGGSVVGFSSGESTSVSKGETIEDTIKTLNEYVDVIAMRHPAIGSARKAAEAADVPVLNGGDGAGQHPTQALLDLFTVKSERGTVDNATIVLCGDLKNGRTVHSGVEIYKHYNCKLICVAPEQLSMPAEVITRLRGLGVDIEETTEIEPAIKKGDFLYMTRIQKERFADVEEYEKLKNSYILTREMVERLNPNLTVMHPLPRVNEITTDVDALPGAAYFRQAGNGVYVRMALLTLVLGKI